MLYASMQNNIIGINYNTQRSTITKGTFEKLDQVTGKKAVTFLHPNFRACVCV